MSDNTTKDWKKFKEKNEQNENNEQLDDLQNEEQETTDEDDGEGEGGDSQESALGHASYTALEEQLTLAEQKAHENWEKAVRAVAELDNYRRRAERDVANAHRYGLEKFITSLLPVLDSLEQALQIAEKEQQTGMLEGLQLTLKLFLDVLNKYEVTPIDPQGEAFNPQEHEAMSIQEVPGAAPNSVLTVFQKGYKLSDRVIRPARVIVAKK
ncbi:heat shock protein GrpE [Legionella beliardensis]|uniref:Protein GrpE n=1 Tax=Legionella beliardensis TaxID=91822 RepID=A0A378HZC8_9GAMM|nr:nucleotide exchange factor GrpE [Legionella beliardensis]STX28103.1 heat shock protein GrpE [Legionella beliardensis]